MVSGHDSVPERFLGIAKTEVSEYLQKPVQIENLYQVALRVLKDSAPTTGEFFMPSGNGDLVSADKTAHDLSNIQMTIQMHCAHFLSSILDGHYKEVRTDQILKDAQESFEIIQRKCIELEKVSLMMKDTVSSGKVSKDRDQSMQTDVGGL
jgi:hypothetical protein